MVTELNRKKGQWKPEEKKLSKISQKKTYPTRKIKK